MARRAFGSIRRLPSKRYQASYLGPDGRRHYAWSTYLNRSDAESWLNDEERLTDRGAEWTPPSHRPPVEESDATTLEDYARAVITRRTKRARKPIKRTTADLYLRLLETTIAPTLGKLAVVDVTPARVQRWYDAMCGTPTHAGNAYLLLRSVMADAVEDGLIERNPVHVKGAGKPATKREGVALTVGELVAYAEHAGEYAVPLLLAAWCSLRSGEVRALRRRDVAADGSWVRVVRTVSKVGRGTREWHFDTPKTAAGVRRAEVPPHFAPVLAAWVEDHPGAPDGLVFPAADGSSPMSDGVLWRRHKAAATAIGRPTMTVHDLRRTGATLAAQSGATIKELMRRLGHTTPAMAMIYQSADDVRDRQLAARMSELD